MSTLPFAAQFLSVTETTNGSLVLTDADDSIVAYLSRDYDRSVGPLLAAAPDLLAALSALRNECSGTPRPDRLVALLAHADEALAKADA